MARLSIFNARFAPFSPHPPRLLPSVPLLTSSLSFFSNDALNDVRAPVAAVAVLETQGWRARVVGSWCGREFRSRYPAGVVLARTQVGAGE